MITVPNTVVADLTGFAGTLFTDLWLVLTVAIGIPLAFYIIRRVVALAKVK